MVTMHKPPEEEEASYDDQEQDERERRVCYSHETHLRRGRQSLNISRDSLYVLAYRKWQMIDG